jgi:CheY-like chemotaxis protein
MLAAEIQRREIRVVMNLEAPTHSVVGDPTRLRQVFWNLIGNALKFTRAGGTITVTSLATSGVVQVTISDSGEGMDPDVVDAINDNAEDTRATPMQSSTGLGLGLAICRGVLTAHGGTLRAMSAGKERGSAFIVRIPVSAHLEEWDRPRPPDDVPSGHATQQLRILLVEDHQDSADTLSQLLSFHGFDVTVARTMHDALESAERGIDFLISDIRLPDGTGLDLMRRLQSRRPVRGIAISGFGTEQDQRRSREAGYGMHLTKPVDFNRLLEAIDQVSGGATALPR